MENQMTLSRENQSPPLTFDALPNAVGELLYKLRNIERLLQQQGSRTKENVDEIVVINKAAEFLHLSLATIYALVSNRKIPFMKKGNRLYFSKKALTEWLYQTERRAIV